MEQKITGRAGLAENNSAVWDELRDDPLLETTEPIEIKRGFAKTLFGTFYDRLGSLILVNVAVCLQVAAGVTIGFVVGAPFSAGIRLVLLVLGGWLFGAPALGGLYSYVRAICDPDMLSTLSEYTRGMRKYAVRSWILLGVQAGSGGLLALNLRFYASLHGLVGLVVMMLVLLMTLLWAMAGVYVWPLLVRDTGWVLLIRNAFFLALAAPFSTIGILLGVSVVSALLIVIRVGVVLALFTAWALTENVALTRLVRVFHERQEAMGTSEQTGQS